METAERVKEYELMNAIWANLSHLAFLQQDSSGMLYARLSYNENLRLAYDRGIANSAICMAEQFSLREQPDSVDHYLRQALTIARSGNYGDNHRIWLAYAADCTMRGDLVRASEYLDSISPDTSDPEKTIAVAYERANIAAKHGNYSVAANLSKSGLTEAKTLKLHIYDNKLLSLLAQCSRHLGHYEVADSCLSQILHNKSLENEDIAKLMTRQRSMLLEIHQRQQSEMLKRQQIQSQRKVILLLTIALILALVLSVYIYWSVRRRQRLYRLIVEKQREALAQRELKKNPSTTHKSDMENGLPDSASEELWQRLEVLLIDEGLYRSPLLNRDMLAERLKTNRTYLSRVIKDHTGLSLPNYVTKLRIEYAVKAISQSSGKSVVLKNLAEEAGFANQATFIRAFKAQVGMSPSQFKSQCDQIDRDSSDTSSMGELELMDKQNSAVELTI
ncbi:MAG: helix-turn-helix domain-containing protein [Bacteroidales bacterium]|nr:helix-turn-helix domain-containing protein [Bacteroidales bacterium]